MLHIAICFTLLTAVFATHLLLKVQKESGGAIAKWISYIILLACAFIFVCLIAQGFSRMCRPHGEKGMQCHEMMGHGMMMGGGMCGYGGGMECGEMGGMHHGMMRGMGGCGQERMEGCGSNKECGDKEGCDDEDDDSVKVSTSHMKKN